MTNIDLCKFGTLCDYEECPNNAKLSDQRPYTYTTYIIRGVWKLIELLLMIIVMILIILATQMLEENGNDLEIDKTLIYFAASVVTAFIIITFMTTLSFVFCTPITRSVDITISVLGFFFLAYVAAVGFLPFTVSECKNLTRRSTERRQRDLDSGRRSARSIEMIYPLEGEHSVIEERNETSGHMENQHFQRRNDSLNDEAIHAQLTRLIEPFKRESITSDSSRLRYTNGKSSNIVEQGSIAGIKTKLSNQSQNELIYSIQNETISNGKRENTNILEENIGTRKEVREIQLKLKNESGNGIYDTDLPVSLNTSKNHNMNRIDKKQRDRYYLQQSLLTDTIVTDEVTDVQYVTNKQDNTPIFKNNFNSTWDKITNTMYVNKPYKYIKREKDVPQKSSTKLENKTDIKGKDETEERQMEESIYNAKEQTYFSKNNLGNQARIRDDVKNSTTSSNVIRKELNYTNLRKGKKLHRTQNSVTTFTRERSSNTKEQEEISIENTDENGIYFKDIKQNVFPRESKVYLKDEDNKKDHLRRRVWRPDQHFKTSQTTRMGLIKHVQDDEEVPSLAETKLHRVSFRDNEIGEGNIIENNTSTTTTTTTTTTPGTNDNGNDNKKDKKKEEELFLALASISLITASVFLFDILRMGFCDEYY